MSKYFTDDGWFKTGELFECSQPLCIAVSARGPGKTYGALDWLTENATEDAKFIHMRRSTAELERMEAKDPYKEIRKDKNRDIEMQRVDKEMHVLRDGEHIGVHMSLHSVSGIRGINMFDYKYWFFDEFIPEKGAYRKKSEDVMMLNAYESINRNRELKGEPAIKLVMCSNLNETYSEIMGAFGYTDELEKIGDAKPIAVLADRDRKLLMINQTEISERKKNTFLYRVANNEEFTNMAIENKKEDLIMPVKDYNRAAYTYLTTLGEVQINVLESGAYYLTRSSTVSDYSKADLRRWAKVYASYTRGRVVANSNYIAMKFVQMFNG